MECFDQDLKEDDVKMCRGVLHNPHFAPIMNYLEAEAERVHSSIVNAITDNPIRDVLVSQRFVGAEQVLRSVISKLNEEKRMLNDM